MTAAIVLQARMGSTRLPGKSMELLEGRPLVERCLERLRSRCELPLALATTTNSEDDCLAALGDRLGVYVVRGSDTDVLGRFVDAIRRMEVDVIVRATGDNPAVDAEAPGRVLALMQRTGADHVVESGLPLGAAVEAVSAAALVAAAEQTDDPYDREHVTPFVRRGGRFFALAAIAPGHLHAPHLRLTVDTRDDLAWMRRLVAAVGGGEFDGTPLETIIACANRLQSTGDATSGRRSIR